MAVLLVACDAHRDIPDTAMKPCHILCTDGNVMSYADYEKSGKQAIAVVFHINQREDVEGNGYAVYLWDIAPESFADSIGVAQGTSADLTAYDGNTIPSPYMVRPIPSPLWQRKFSTSGDTDRVPISRVWHKCDCCMLPRL